MDGSLSQLYVPTSSYTLKGSTDTSRPAELPLLFGTHYEFRGNSTEYEYEVSQFMEGEDFTASKYASYTDSTSALWLSFASKPDKAPTAMSTQDNEFEWPEYQPDVATLTRFADDNTLVSVVDPAVIDSRCNVS